MSKFEMSTRLSFLIILFLGHAARRDRPRAENIASQIAAFHFRPRAALDFNRLLTVVCDSATTQHQRAARRNAHAAFAIGNDVTILQSALCAVQKNAARAVFVDFAVAQNRGRIAFEMNAVPRMMRNATAFHHDFGIVGDENAVGRAANQRAGA